MKVKCFVLAAAITLIAAVKVSAKEPPVGDNPQPVCTKTHVETEATSSVLTSIEENTEYKEQELQFYESTVNNNDSINLYIKANSTIDTATFNGLKKYFKSIQPVIRKLDLQDIEKIEIL